jgi:hypothetical protein
MLHYVGLTPILLMTLAAMLAVVIRYRWATPMCFAAVPGGVTCLIGWWIAQKITADPDDSGTSAVIQLGLMQPGILVYGIALMVAIYRHERAQHRPRG